jgi:hypothetical protein
VSTTEVHTTSGDTIVGMVGFKVQIAHRPAEAHHREHHRRTGRSHLLHRSSQDKNGPAWYASDMVAEQAATDLPA